MSSRKANITKRVVDALNPGEIVWDTKKTGFGVRCQRKGKVYILKTRISGQQRWFTIGTHGQPWNVDKARAEVDSILGEIADGKDPATKRDMDAKADTIKSLVPRFITEEIEPRGKAKTTHFYRDILNRLLVPEYGKRKAMQITQSDMRKLHRGMRDRPVQANRLLAVASSMFAWVEDEGERDKGTNPCVGIKKFKEQKRERFLSTAELAKLGEVLATCEADGTEGVYVLAAIRLLIFTGARLSEILTLKWSYVDIERGLLLLPESKTGQKPIYLNAPAIELLSELPNIKGNPYVICGKLQGAHIVNLQKPWRRIRKLAEIDDVRIHDLRHSYASIAAAGGASLPIIGRLLGHTQAATTQRYSHLADDPVRAANEAIGATILAVMKGKYGKVVKLPRKG